MICSDRKLNIGCHNYICDATNVKPLQTWDVVELNRFVSHLNKLNHLIPCCIECETLLQLVCYFHRFLATSWLWARVTTSETLLSTMLPWGTSGQWLWPCFNTGLILLRKTTWVRDCPCTSVKQVLINDWWSLINIDISLYCRTFMLTGFLTSAKS